MLFATIRVEHSDASGTFLAAKSLKKTLIEVNHSNSGKSELTIHSKPAPVRLLLEPPVALNYARMADGLMSVRFPRVALGRPGAKTFGSVLVAISEALPEDLTKLCDHINRILAKAPGARPFRPLQPLNTNPAHERLTGKRKAHDEAARPAMSGSSLGSARSLGSGRSYQQGATFSSAVSRDAPQAEEVEQLAPLSDEQQRVLDRVTAGRNVFFTGCAGTGKSLLLKHILRALPRDTTFVTASTGLAACALGGTTINSFAGIGRGEAPFEVLAKGASRGETAQRWRRARALILDEISMVDAKLFDLLEALAQRVRGTDAPFGGIQLILAGDFHQLPPVAKGKEATALRKFCFQASSWQECNLSCHLLTKVFRQADSGFVDMLATIREGKASESVLQKLKAVCARPLDTSDGILPTKLYSHREDVDLINSKHLGDLDGESVKFIAQDAGGAPDILAAACPAKAVVELKVGAQVMLTRNVSYGRGLVNGARGVVQRFSNGSLRLPVVRFASGEVSTVGKERWTIAAGGRVLAMSTQLPLELAWAMSVHKSQGMTLDRVEVCLEKAFEPGMAYVALSRAKSLEGLALVGSINPRALAAHPSVCRFYRELQYHREQ